MTAAAAWGDNRAAYVLACMLTAGAGGRVVVGAATPGMPAHAKHTRQQQRCGVTAAAGQRARPERARTRVPSSLEVGRLDLVVTRS